MQEQGEGSPQVSRDLVAQNDGMKAESRDLPFSTHRWAAQPERVTTMTVRTASSPSSPSSSGSRQTWHARSLNGAYEPGTCTRAISMWELRRRVCAHPLPYFLSVRWCCRKEEEEEREYPIMPRCLSRPAGQMDDGWTKGQMDRRTEGQMERWMELFACLLYSPVSVVAALTAARAFAVFKKSAQHQQSSNAQLPVVQLRNKSLL